MLGALHFLPYSICQQLCKLQISKASCEGGSLRQGFAAVMLGTPVGLCVGSRCSPRGSRIVVAPFGVCAAVAPILCQVRALGELLGRTELEGEPHNLFFRDLFIWKVEC